MRSIALAFLVLSVISCQKSDLSDPFILEGDYITNGLLDISCVAVDQDKLPTLVVTKRNIDSYDMILTRYMPVKSTTIIKNLQISQENGIDKLIYQDKNAGSWKKFEGFGDKKILTISIQFEPSTFIYFVGMKK